MGQFGQFGLNGFKRGHTLQATSHISGARAGELEIFHFVCNLITVMRGFAKVRCMGCDY